MDFSLIPIWLANGFLVIVFTLAEHLVSLLLLIPLVWLNISLPHRAGQFFKKEFRPYLLGASGTAMAASIFAPQPVPNFLLIMAVASGIALLVEQGYNPAETYWTIVRGIALYALAGIGFALFQLYLESRVAANDPNTGAFMLQGQNYLGIMVAIAMYAMPILYMGMLAKEILAHPPADNPANMVKKIRTGGNNSYDHFAD